MRSRIVCIQQHSMFKTWESVSRAVLTSFSGSLVRDNVSLISLIAEKTVSVLMVENPQVNETRCHYKTNKNI